MTESVTIRLRRSLITVTVILLIWQAIVSVFQFQAFILPPPLDVGRVLIERYPILLHHTWVTTQEVCLGLLLGVFLGLVLALTLLLNKTIKRWVLPLLIMSQAIPFFAIAPILMLWLGYGMASKIAMASVIIFFPITTCCYDGLRQTPQGYLDLAHTFNLTRWQTLRRIKLPAALPALASGLRVSVVIAPIGAVIGEWVGSSEGLGYFMLQSNARMMIADVFAALFLLSLFSIVLYFTTDRVLNRIIKWPSNA